MTKHSTCCGSRLTAPRFDAEAVERVRGQILAGLRRETTRPEQSCQPAAGGSTAFPGHPYGRESKGTLETVPRITVGDLRDYVHRVFARNELTISIVGDIDAAAAGKLIDRAFATLPAKNDLKPVPQASPQGLGRRIVIKLDVPQAVVTFGGPGIDRHDPDFMAGYVVNHILGGGDFHVAAVSRSAREARPGLRRIRQPGLVPPRRGRDRRHRHPRRPHRRCAGDHRSVRPSAWPTRARRRKNSPRPSPILKGAYALSLDTSTKIAAQLTEIQIDNLGIDYIQRRGGLIDGVTIEDAKRVAKRLYGGGMLVTVAGRPKGLASTSE